MANSNSKPCPLHKPALDLQSQREGGRDKRGAFRIRGILMQGSKGGEVEVLRGETGTMKENFVKKVVSV